MNNNALSITLRNTGMVTNDPDVCDTCGEHRIPRANKGSYKCRCDMPRAPRHVLAEQADKPLPSWSRYGN